jgi:hypothetical protein
MIARPAGIEGEWQVYVSGREEDMAALVKLTKTQKDWRIEDVGVGNGRCFLRSDSVQRATTAREASQEAERLLDDLLLVAKLSGYDLHPLSIVDIYRDLGVGKRETVLVAQAGHFEIIGARATAILESADGSRRYFPPLLELHRSLRNSDFHDAVELFINGQHDWRELYKIVEIVEHAAKPIPRDWISASKLKLLKQTSQYPKTAGKTARHARLGSDPPSRAMPLDEAQELVRQILLAWSSQLEKDHRLPRR